MVARSARDRRRARPNPPPELGRTPPAMWPEPGSGYEANQYSPAGQMQTQWLFLQGLRRRRWGRWVLRVFAVLVVLPVLLQVATLL